MYERYHIRTEPTPGSHRPVPKFLVDRADNCMNCGRCERACVYGAHKRDPQDPRKMAEPDSTLCKNCFRCVVECPQRALSIKVNEEYRALGHGVWTPVRVTTIWNEAENAKIPVLGAGYRGNFSGPGFDAMWTDMSEIVRPTRDGIHGREFISTSVDLGRKPSHLSFDARGGMTTIMPPIIDLPVPFILDLSRLEVDDERARGVAMAASDLRTLLVIPRDLLPKVTDRIAPELLVPVIRGPQDVEGLPSGVRMVEMDVHEGWERELREIRSIRPGTMVALRVPSSAELASTVDDMAREADVLHVLFDEEGRDRSGVHARDALRRLHRYLVAAGLRDGVTVISSGGLAAAEMVPKSVICGADAVTLERVLLVAVGCRACSVCGEECPSGLANVSEEFVRGRITNMGSAWRDQMLEMLGAMGIKEVRRLRGETGRAIFEEDAHRDAFSNITGGVRID